LSLFVLSMALAWRSRAALAKGVSMGLFGLWVLTAATLNALTGEVPSAPVMGAVGALALAANVAVAVLLFGFRNGDANMRSVWLCTRNDAIGNVAVMAAALGVFGTQTAWPDIAVAAIMASLALAAAFLVIRDAMGELANGTPAAGTVDGQAHHGH
jgi:Co/Zn/Cd efflux system component